MTDSVLKFIAYNPGWIRIMLPSGFYEDCSRWMFESNEHFLRRARKRADLLLAIEVAQDRATFLLQQALDRFSAEQGS